MWRRRLTPVASGEGRKETRGYQWRGIEGNGGGGGAAAGAGRRRCLPRGHSGGPLWIYKRPIKIGRIFPPGRITWWKRPWRDLRGAGGRVWPLWPFGSGGWGGGGVLEAGCGPPGPSGGTGGGGLMAAASRGCAVFETAQSRRLLWPAVNTTHPAPPAPTLHIYDQNIAGELVSRKDSYNAFF